MVAANGVKYFRYNYLRKEIFINKIIHTLLCNDGACDNTTSTITAEKINASK